MNKEDLALNNLKWLICHNTQRNLTKPNKTKPIFECMVNRAHVYTKQNTLQKSISLIFLPPAMGN